MHQRGAFRSARGASRGTNDHGRAARLLDACRRTPPLVRRLGVRLLLLLLVVVVSVVVLEEARLLVISRMVPNASDGRGRLVAFLLQLFANGRIEVAVVLGRLPRRVRLDQAALVAGARAAGVTGAGTGLRKGITTSLRLKPYK